MVVRGTGIILVLIILIDIFFSSLSGTLGNYFDEHWPAIINGMGLALIPFRQSPADINFEFLKKNISGFSIVEKRPAKKLRIELSMAYRGNSSYEFSLSFFSRSDLEHLKQVLAKTTRKRAKSDTSPLVNVG